MFSPPNSNECDSNPNQFKKFNFNNDSESKDSKSLIDSDLNSPLSLNDGIDDDNNNINNNNINNNNNVSQYPIKKQSNDDDDNDQFSINSSISHSSYNSRIDNNSLIFERLVQDPLTDAQPIPHSLPRHISCETFIPASLDATTHMFNDSNNLNNFNNLGFESNNFEPVEFGFSSRRSSLANLEAALGTSSRRPSSANLQSFRNNSISNTNLSRSNTNSSFSNLTQQFQNASVSNLNSSVSVSVSNARSNSNLTNKRIPQNQNQNLNSNSNSNSISNQNRNQIPQAQPLSQSNSQHSQTIASLPPLTTSLTSNSINSNLGLRNSSPMLKNKSFCSYADIIAQDDHESNFSIRRPSISVSLSSQKLARTNSVSSNPNSNQLSNCNSPRSPSYSTSPFAKNFRSNSISTYNNNIAKLKSQNSPSMKNNSDFTYSSNSAIDSECDNDQIFSTSINTPRKLSSYSGFSGRPINSSSYAMRVSNSNTSQNIDELLKIKKKDISPQSSRSMQNDLVSDEESLKSFKTANLSTE